MGGKHMKKLRAEKSKVQFKKKKLLPKGQNITDTSFTVKKIVTIEQLKKVDESVPVSNWNVPLKDLLIRLNHYNFTSRLNGLNGIKELLMKYPEILNGPSFKNLISKVPELLIDEEHKIRKTAIELLSFIFDLIPSTSIIPFYDLLSVHLGCVMTHRNSSVQRDSLKFIDVLIKYAPEALKHNFKSVSKNFIRILKTQVFECHSGGGKELEKGKTEILVRFYDFLTAGLSGIVHEEHVELSCRVDDGNVLKDKINLRNACDQYKKVPDLSSLFKGSGNEEKILTEFDVNEFQNLCSGIIPMLTETWIEFSPEKVAFGSVMTDNIGELLLVILKIIALLHVKAVALGLENWFLMNFAASFEKSFTQHFPYLPSIPMKKSESNNYSEYSGKGITQNLLISSLLYSFHVVPKNSPIETKIEDFLSNALMTKNPTEVRLLLKLVDLVLFSSKNKKTNILNKMLTAYNSTTNSDLKHGLSKILTNFILEEKMNLNENIFNWMKSLANCLCQSEIFFEEIEIILKLITRREGSDLLKEVETKGKTIMKNLPNVKISGISQLEGQKMIVNILYRCGNEILEIILKNVVESTLYSKELRDYTKDVFFFKFGKPCSNVL